MDIVQSSRAYFAMPSPSAEDKITLQASNTVYTYHCLCSHLLLATTTPLPALPTRQNSQDKAHIMPLPPASSSNKSDSTSNGHYGLLLSTRQERSAEMMTSDDGFEKRYLQRCGRCNLAVGYQLDWAQFGGDRTGRRDDIVFLIPGGFMTTSEMINHKKSASAAANSGGGGVAGMASATAVAA
ncbi:uncharacterized protein EKO05_0011043 [Ascochyta rabiei]|uniref:STEEP1 domain-containing protein n=1 Tax=Didymella rabiei TaxID=5454 RepID=A0A163LYA7_DIDRA|nr:uncharacterized protein EKO05_0011043 [Ascochyta rabiei]KZM28230.1 hypothetical protein ST47_g621 [Ascochyta rabiei]UPX20826.1 hypothetical protein EKO05_0011043 [Ascochyta rabiei]